MAASEMIGFEAAFETAQKRFNGDRPSWWHDARRRAFDDFRQRGLPTRRDEEWKYTNVRQLGDVSYRLPESATPTSNLDAYAAYRDDADLELIFIDGVFDAAQSRLADLPAGVWAGSVEQALPGHGDVIQQFLSAWDGADAFAYLNGAFLETGAFIDVDPNTVVPVMIHVLHVITDAGKASMTSPRTFVRVGRSSEVRILESFVSHSGEACFINQISDMDVAENAHLEHCMVQAQGLEATHIGTTRVRQAAHSHVATFACALGAKLARHNLRVELNGEGTHTNLDGLYATKDGQHVDNHTSIDHRHPNSTSNQLYKGVLNGKSRAVFNGKIFVRDIAQKTNAYQLNRNLMLGPECKVDTKPQLEIFADDVKCTHGAAIGQLDDEEIFYLESRGISREHAVRLLSHGFARDVFERVQDEGIRARLEQHLAEYFGDALA
ncbi:MAG: Fe-S cluster assembly protein SufD [Verrucomicrobia bacterium]|nr:Fe-S cluster assembly protein SufD [Verrucomicrobiota bacterium]MDA1088245.1 Fe-S cluster assembly protein SufD [Verrucomicrobiota bacterium]